MSSAKSDKPADANARAVVGDNSIKEGFGTNLHTIPVDAVTIWLPAEEQSADVDTVVIDEAVEAAGAGKQRFPVPVRVLADGKYEAVARGYLVVAARIHNERFPDRPVEIEVRICTTLSDEGAFRFLAQDVEQDHTPSSLARGQFFARAVAQFGSEKDAAAACRTSVAAVSKNLDVARVLPFIRHKVVIPRDIAQRDASWLMSQIGRHPKGTDAPDSAIRKRLLDTIEGLNITTARKLFVALKGAVKPHGEIKPRKGVHPVVVDGRDIGTVRAKKGDRVTIDLAGAGDIPLDELMAHIGAVVARTRS